MSSLTGSWPRLKKARAPARPSCAAPDCGRSDIARSRNSDEQWMRTVLRSGTTSDKLSAMTLLVQQAPFYRLKACRHVPAMSLFGTNSIAADTGDVARPRAEERAARELGRLGRTQRFVPQQSLAGAPSCV